MSKLNGVIKRIKADGTWNSQSGKLYYAYMVQMEDGTSGQYSDSRYETPEALPFGPGDPVAYEYIAHKYPKIKDIEKKAGDAIPPPSAIPPNQGFNRPGTAPAPGGSYNKELNIVRESCIGSASRLYAQRTTFSPLEVLKTAQAFENYVLTGTLPQE